MAAEHLIPFFIISGVIVLLNVLFCCYLTSASHKPLMKWLKKRGRTEQGFKKIKYRKSRSLNETCAICLEDFKSSEPIGQCPCNHGFHILCISKWLESRNTCPVCKVPPKVTRPTENSYLVSI